ncbi:sulfurtransferase FdhD [Marmoricola endophyticus]|uniref:Sulfur carrier protein FdhD n=1 Tax=Marmoricola endophyticus TaxID=2040280 RepID=A0A917BEI3_9ACTN|nr:formate dehydrogenase accessory sulfurtransferase FdhD [Marmoricola endophyticus]GGF34792.1 sulfurtransferase FdhD [Marmoricola endophyticus]
MRSDRRPGPTVRAGVRELRDGRWTAHEDKVVTEEPLEVRLASPGVPARRVSVTMRTPGHDFELAAGWMFHEGVLDGPDDLQQVAYCTDRDLTPEQELNVVTVTTSVAERRTPGGRYPGITSASSACGVCGADSIEEVFAGLAGRPRTVPQVELDADVLRGLPDAMRERQRLFDRTGGLHAAGLSTTAGELCVVREDVGRHNAVDKVSGALLLGTASLQGPPVLVTSGRLGFEIVQKAVAAGVTAVVGVGAPTSLSVELARGASTVLVGWSRGGRAVVYVGADRLV